MKQGWVLIKDLEDGVNILGVYRTLAAASEQKEFLSTVYPDGTYRIVKTSVF